MQSLVGTSATYTSIAITKAAIAAGTAIPEPTSAFAQLELAQLGFIVACGNGTIVDVVVQKDTFNARYIGGSTGSSLSYTAQTAQALTTPGTAYAVQDYKIDPSNTITVSGTNNTTFRNVSGGDQYWDISYVICLQTASSLTVVLITWITVSITASMCSSVVKL